MTTASLSTDGLAQLHDVMAGHVEAGEIPGLVTLVARGDDVHVDAIGSPSFADDTPLAPVGHLPHRVAHEADHRGGDDVTGRGGRAAPGPASRGPAARARAAHGSCAPSTPRSTTQWPRVRPITVEDLLSYRLGFGTRRRAARLLSHPTRRGRAAPTEHRWSAVAAGGVRRPTGGWRLSAPCRSCTNRASSGSTTRRVRCSVCCWLAWWAGTSRR